jgi:soluble lytic murein transglycosylase
LGLGHALYRLEEYGLALNQLAFGAESEDPSVAGRANYLMAKAYTQLQRYQEALESYQAYLDLRPGLLDSHIHEMRGDLYSSLVDFENAITEFELAYETEPSGGTERLAVKIARAYQSAGDVDTALSQYQEIVTATQNDYTKAEMNLLIAQIYLEREETEAAYPYLQDSVNTVPFAYDAYTALVILVDAGVAVDEYQRGLVNYYAGNYLLAVEAFDRYLASGPETSADAALYHKALATRASGSAEDLTSYETAINLWEQLILDYAASDFYVDAWQEIEYTLWAYLGEPQLAAEHALRYVAQRPESPEASDFLFLAGRSYERAGLLNEAADTWTRVADEYPASSETFRTSYFAGIAHIRLGDWVTAEALFSRALVLTSEPAQVAAAHLWIGKCQEAQGNISAALDSWKIAQTSDPFGHYSIRAEDLLIDRDVFTEPDSFDLDPNLEPYRLEAETWLRQTFELPEDTNLESPGLLINDPRLQRGLEFWSLGNYEAAKTEFEALRLELAADPAQTFRLIPTLVEIGLYRSALVASTELLKLAGLQAASALDAPEFFSRVRFGAYYLDWLLPIAADNEISPLLLLSIMRQESTYEGFISSSAGARGLMQIIPSTGAQLAAELDWPPNYTEDDLNRPYVSLVFGANYLRKQRNFFGGDLFAMLAAYNGGPGNTIAWLELTPIDDPDLFLEIIRIEETRNYIRLINEIHYIYKWLYGENLR